MSQTSVCPVHVRFGEHGDIRDGFPATREALGSIRQSEDEAAWRALGRVPDRHEWLGLTDGGVAEVPFDDVVSAVARILDEEDPAVVVTFGPDGIFGHPDHVAIGAATDEAFARLHSESRSGFQRLAHGAVPQSVFERWNRQRSELGLYAFDPTQTSHRRGIPDEQIRITIDCREGRPHHGRPSRAQEPTARHVRRPHVYRSVGAARWAGVVRDRLARARTRCT